MTAPAPADALGLPEQASPCPALLALAGGGRPRRRALTWRQRACLAWVAGLLDEREVCASECLTGEVFSSLVRRGLLERAQVEARWAHYQVTVTGGAELTALGLTRPAAVPSVSLAQARGEGYRVEPCALFDDEHVVICNGCGKLLGGGFKSREEADAAAWLGHVWHPEHGCPTCERAARPEASRGPGSPSPASCADFAAPSAPWRASDRSRRRARPEP